LSFGLNQDLDAIKLLVAYASVSELKDIEPPNYASFVHFKPNEKPTVESLFSIIASRYPIMELKIGQRRIFESAESRRQRESYKEEGTRLAHLLVEQWPSFELSVEDITFESELIDMELILEAVNPEWRRLYQNLELSNYLKTVQDILKRYKGPEISPINQNGDVSSTFFRPSRQSCVVPLVSPHLVGKSGPQFQDQIVENGFSTSSSISTQLTRFCSVKEITELSEILIRFVDKSTDALRQQYGDDLKRSLSALNNANSRVIHQKTAPTLTFVNKGIENVQTVLGAQIEKIQNAFSAGDERFIWLRIGQLWPFITARTLLEQLRSISGNAFGERMKEALVAYGIRMTHLQRLLRMRQALMKQDQRKLFEELENNGHQNWNPFDFPDWLLLEIDGNILIRREQVEVAHAILSPASRSNSVLQMNMGKGE
jgi:hypothetical protein